MTDRQSFAFLPQATVNSEKLNALPISARWIYVVLIAEQRGLNVPFRMSYNKIHEITRCSSATIRIAIKALEKAGFLEYDKGGLEANPNVYTLEVSWLRLDEGDIASEPPEKYKYKNPYPPEWTKELRRRIRKRDGDRCRGCGVVKSLCVHHIDHDKQNCDEKNLVTLCKGCHAKARGSEATWEEFFYSGTLLSARL